MKLFLILNQWFRRCHLKIFLKKNTSNPFVLLSGTICAILIEGIMRNISVK